MSNINDFEFIHPKRNRPTSAHAKEIIRTVFTKNKRASGGYILNIYVGKKLAEKIKLSAGDKVQVGYDKKDSRRVLLRKGETGYTAAEISGDKSPSLRVMLQWQIFQPEEENFTLSEAKQLEIDDDGNIAFSI